MFDHVMSYGMHMYTYVREQYKFIGNLKAKMVLLPRGLCRVRVKGFRFAISLWHEFSKSAPT